MAWLAVSWSDGRSDSIELTHRRPVSVGSHSGSDVIADESASMACRVAWNGSDYEAVAAADDDIRVNGKRTRRRKLADRDEVQVGDVILMLRRGHMPKDDPDDEFPEEAPPPRQAEVETEDEAVDDGAVEEEIKEAYEDGDDLSDKPVTETAARSATSKSKIRERLHARARRPGEQDTIRSPMIYGMAGGVVVLLVATLALTLFVRGQSITQQFQSAMAAQEAGRYSDAEKEFDRFVKRNPGHSLAPKARRQLALTRADRVIRGETPNWQRGIRLLNDVIGSFRDDEDFDTIHGDIAERSGLIALGAATDAGRRRDADLVGISEKAEDLLGRYSPDAVAPETLIEKVASARTVSRNRLVQLDVLDDFVKRMTTASEANDSLGVLSVAGQLETADRELVSESAVSSLVTGALEELRQRVKSLDLASLAAEPPAPAGDVDVWNIATIAVVDRPAGEAKPDGRSMLVWHDGTYFSCDRSSGDPAWATRLPGSFRPMPITIPVEGAVAYSERDRAIVAVDHGTGEVVRSIPLPDSASAARPKRPRISGAVAFVPVGSRIYRIEVEAARVTAATDFGQPLLAEPVLLKTPVGEVLLAIGEAQLAYLIDPRTLAMIDMFRIGHESQSIQTPGVAAAEFVIVAENQPRNTTCEISLLTVDGSSLEELRVRKADRETVDGLVVDAPVIRGRDLFVASSPERATVFTVSDEDGGKLTQGARFMAGRSEDTPGTTYLLPTADREFWLAGRRLQRLRATAEAIRVVGDPISIRDPIQPPVLGGTDVYIAARRTAGTTATLSRVDATRFTERWQVQIGGNVVGIVPLSSATSVSAVTEKGDIVRIDPDATGFVSNSVDKLSGRVRSTAALGDRLVVANGRAVTIVGPTGRAGRRIELATPAVAPVISWNEQFVVPILGKLKVYDRSGRQTMADFWLTQGGENAPKWRSVYALDESHLVTIDEAGMIRVLTAVAGQNPHLAETANLQVDAGSAVQASDGIVWVASGNSVTAYDGLSLAKQDVERSLDAGVRAVTSLALAGTEVIATGQTETGYVLVRVSDGVQAELDDRPVGPTQASAQGYLVTLKNRVVILNPGDFAQTREISLPGVASAEARVVGTWLTAPLEDGSLAFAPFE